MDNAINTISLTKIELGKKINGRLDIFQIVDEGKQRLEEQFGPLPDPHRGHNHNHRGHNHDHKGHNH